MADVGCRNTIFGAEAQTDPRSMANWRAAGIQHFRIEFVHQDSDQVKAITRAFGEFFAADIHDETMAALANSLSAASPQATTQGSLYVSGDSKSLVQLK